MKAIAAAILMIGGAVSVTWAEDAPPLKITDTEATIMVKTIEGFMETKGNYLQLFDRKRGAVVPMAMKRLVIDQPGCVIFMGEDRMVVCVECVEVSRYTDEEGKTQTKEEDTQYVVWFLLQRGSVASSRVLDTTIKSINGEEITAWVQNASGEWEITRVGAAPATVAPAESPEPAPAAAE